jgi:CheY-like chemotaxis protein
VVDHPVLVSEDDDDVRTVLAELLEGEGYEVAQTRNGAEALEWLRGHTPCVIVLDLMMPGVSGWDVLARMREDPRLSHVPVCVISATDPKNAPDGIDCFLPKPIEIDRLLAEIEQRCGPSPRSS